MEAGHGHVTPSETHNSVAVATPINDIQQRGLNTLPSVRSFDERTTVHAGFSAYCSITQPSWVPTRFCAAVAPKQKCFEVSRPNN